MRQNWAINALLFFLTSILCITGLCIIYVSYSELKRKDARIATLQGELKECHRKPTASTELTSKQKEKIDEANSGTNFRRVKKKPVSMDNSRQLIIGSNKNQAPQKRYTSDEKKKLLLRALRDLPASDNSMNEKMATVEDHEPDRHFLD